MTALTDTRSPIHGQREELWTLAPEAALVVDTHAVDAGLCYLFTLVDIFTERKIITK